MTMSQNFHFETSLRHPPHLGHSPSIRPSLASHTLNGSWSQNRDRSFHHVEVPGDNGILRTGSNGLTYNLGSAQVQRMGEVFTGNKLNGCAMPENGLLMDQQMQLSSIQDILQQFKTASCSKPQYLNGTHNGVQSNGSYNGQPSSASVTAVSEVFSKERSFAIPHLLPGHLIQSGIEHQKLTPPPVALPAFEKQPQELGYQLNGVSKNAVDLQCLIQNASKLSGSNSTEAQLALMTSILRSLTANLQVNTNEISTKDLPGVNGFDQFSPIKASTPGNLCPPSSSPQLNDYLTSLNFDLLSRIPPPPLNGQRDQPCRDHKSSPVNHSPSEPKHPSFSSRNGRVSVHFILHLYDPGALKYGKSRHPLSISIIHSCRWCHLKHTQGHESSTTCNQVPYSLPPGVLMHEVLH